jgi:GNAT superfamily N-acetyltransferase
VAAITRAAFEQYGRALGLPGAVSALRETELDVQRAIDTQHVLVAEVDGVPVGSVRYQDIGNLGYLSRFGVRPDQQQGGIGVALVRAVETACRELGLPAIALHTGARMADLVHFYYRAGYFIHSTSTDRGYIRALFVRELGELGAYDLAPAFRK